VAQFHRVAIMFHNGAAVEVCDATRMPQAKKLTPYQFIEKDKNLHAEAPLMHNHLFKK
jgi:hypothetical protein